MTWLRVKGPTVWKLNVKDTTNHTQSQAARGYTVNANLWRTKYISYVNSQGIASNIKSGASNTEYIMDTSG